MTSLSNALPLCLLAAAIGFTATPYPAAASAVRCKGPDGRISYQDSSCPHGAHGTPVDTTPNMGFQFATRQQIDKARREAAAEAAPPVRARSAARPKARKVLNAGDRRFIRTGMHASEVRRRFGPPDEIARPMSANSRRPDRGASQQWIYHPASDDPQTTTVVTVRHGMVLHVDRRVTP